MNYFERNWEYRNQVILAPMVHICSLPFRLLVAKYGATLMYSEEIIDYKLLTCERIINNRLGTIDFIPSNSDKITFRTLKNRTEPVVLQLGTADPFRAVTSSRIVEKDIYAVDVNMGCPVRFSTHGGMGSALLKDSNKIIDILIALVKNLSVPVTCKIRLLKDTENTIKLCRIIEGCGVSALAIHARHVNDQSRLRALYEEIPIIAKSINIPIIYNGDVFTYKDINRYRELTTTSNIMIARGALWNPSVFHEQMQPLSTICSEFYELAKKFDNNFVQTKTVLWEILKNHIGKDNLLGTLVPQAKNYSEMDTALDKVLKCDIIQGPYTPPNSIIPLER